MLFRTTIYYMPKTAICSWRIDPKPKRALEAKARREGMTLPELLNRMLQQELREHRLRLANDEAEQARRHAATAKYAGTITSGDPHFSENVSSKIRARIEKRHRPRTLTARPAGFGATCNQLASERTQFLCAKKLS